MGLYQNDLIDVIMLDYIQMIVCVEELRNLVYFMSVVSGSACYELIHYSCHDCYVC